VKVDKIIGDLTNDDKMIFDKSISTKWMATKWSATKILVQNLL